jgi:hypothetical protein
MRKRIGDFLLDKGAITRNQVEEILKYSEKTGLRFGEAALELGFVTRERLVEIFGPHHEVDFFHLQPEYFPLHTRDALSLDIILKWGVLPLGFKAERKLFSTRRILNLGALDPKRPGLREACIAACPEAHGVRPYLVLGDQFVAILTQVYGVSPERLAGLREAEADPTLQLFL